VRDTEKLISTYQILVVNSAMWNPFGTSKVGMVNIIEASLRSGI